MRGMVFIAWSENTRALAITVKEKLDSRGYSCVIGGDYERNPEFMRRRTQTVHDTVCYQMDRCSQTIMLFRKPEKNQTISGNMIYELGYVTSRMNLEQRSSKLHIFEIDITKKEKNLFFPSDLEGVWGRPLSSAGLTNEELADRVVEEFLRCQELIKLENKMQLVSNYHRVEYELDYHKNKPLISDYELAKRLIVYIQAAYIFQEHDSALVKCVQLRDSLSDKTVRSMELAQALEYAILTFELFDLAKPAMDGDGRVHLSGREYRSMLRKYRAVASAAYHQSGRFSDEKFEMETVRLTELQASGDEFRAWLIAQAQGHVTYLALVYLENPDLKPDEREKCALQALEFGAASIHNLSLLEELEGNSEYAKLQLGYVYRNMANFYRLLGNREAAEIHEKRAFDMRKDLYDTFLRMPNANPALKNYISLEYFLQISDMLKTMDAADDMLDDVLDNLDEMKAYIAGRSLHESAKGMVFYRLTQAFQQLTEKYDV